MFHLPIEILRKIYEYDPTFRDQYKMYKDGQCLDTTTYSR